MKLQRDLTSIKDILRNRTFTQPRDTTKIIYEFMYLSFPKFRLQENQKVFKTPTYVKKVRENE